MLKIEELKEGEYYSTIDNFEKKSVFISNKLRNYKYFISTNLWENGSWRGEDIDNNIKHATDQEKHWLNCCIEANKCIDYDTAMETFKEEQKFIKGRWYKNIGSNRDYIAKFDKFKNNKFYYTDYIYSKKFFEDHTSWLHHFNDTCECQLSEIIEYLSKDYPDRIEYERGYDIYGKSNIPEYVKLVKGWSVNGEYMGEVFKLSDLSNLSKFKQAPSKQVFREQINSWIKEGHFQTSNQEEYEKQNMKQEINCEYKVGDFIVYNEKDVLKITNVALDSIHDYWIDHTPNSFSGGGFAYKTHKSKIRKAKLEEIPTDNLTNEEILNIAKQFYPIGTKFYGLFGGAKDRINTVSNKNYFNFVNSSDKINNLAVHIEEKSDTDDNTVSIYTKSTGWAKIISFPISNDNSDFVLPGKWCIKVTDDNHKICDKWRKKQKNCNDRIYLKCWLVSEIHDDSYCHYLEGNKPPEGYTKITFKQFKQYVLKESNNSIFPIEKIQNRISELEDGYNPNEIIIKKPVKSKQKIEIKLGNTTFAHVNIPVIPKQKQKAKEFNIKNFSLTI